MLKIICKLTKELSAEGCILGRIGVHTNTAMTDYFGDIRQRARSEAARVLDRYWGGLPMPVDPVKIARDLGLSVFNAQLGNDAWGMIVGKEGGADIYLDRDQPANRFRFSCAHEIGHYIDRDETDVYFVDRRSDRDRGHPAEVFANEFAGSLLMPEQRVKECVAARMNELEMADFFAVSVPALRYRCKLLEVS